MLKPIESHSGPAMSLRDFKVIHFQIFVHTRNLQTFEGKYGKMVTRGIQGFSPNTGSFWQFFAPSLVQGGVSLRVWRWGNRMEVLTTHIPGPKMIRQVGKIRLQQQVSNQFGQMQELWIIKIVHLTPKSKTAQAHDRSLRCFALSLNLI